MNKHINWQSSIFVIVSFIVAVYGKRHFVRLFDIHIDSLEWRIVHHYLWWFIPLLVCCIILFGFKSIPKELGLSASMQKGFIYAFLFTVPMLIGYAIFGHINEDENILSLLRTSLLPGFMEELLFRGFLFGLLFRKFGWGFIPAGMIAALIFGFQHLYQGDNFIHSLGVFGVTFIGALWFAWLYIEWEENLWLVIFLHTLMNLYWGLFNISETGALGGQEANIFRAITITITVIATIRLCKNNKHFAINRDTLWINKASIH